MAKRKRKVESSGFVPVLNDHPQMQIGDISKQAYVEYGSYVNTERHVCHISDGLKVSYRRLIFAAMQFPKGKNIDTDNLISSVSKWHPHSTDGLLGFNAELVNSGVFSGEGSFGSKGIDGDVKPCAAGRYTQNRLSDLYWGLIGDLVKEVPYHESPKGLPEPDFIPLPLPLCLYLNSAVSGIGVGLKVDYPNFSPKSLYKAYINNDPKLLDPGIDIRMDKKKSELSKLWTMGRGKVIYSYRISRQKSPDGKTEGILFEGETGIFTPSFKKLDKLVSEGKVFIDDWTDVNGTKLFVGRVPGARGVTIEDIETICRQICYKSTEYTLYVSNGQEVYRIPLYNWIEHTYQTYIALLNEVNQKRIERTMFDISVQEALPIIASYVLNTNPKASNQELVRETGFDLVIIKEVMSKPIEYLRRDKDATERAKRLKVRLKELKNFNPVAFTETVIDRL